MRTSISQTTTFCLIALIFTLSRAATLRGIDSGTTLTDSLIELTKIDCGKTAPDFVWSSADDGISDVSWVGYVTGKTLQQAKDECEKPTRLDTNGKRCSGLFESNAGQYHFLYPGGKSTFKKGGSTRAVYKLIDLGNVAAADKVNADAKGETYYFYCERFFSFQY